MTPEEQSLVHRCEALLVRGTKPRVPEVSPLVRAYYDLGNITGGSLHIVLDDGNVEDHHVQFCVQYAIDHGDRPGEVLGRVLMLMSKTQRGRV